VPQRLERVMKKLTMVLITLGGIAAFATIASSAEDLAAAVKERRHLMKEVVAPAAKLGGQMVKGVVEFDADKIAAKMSVAMSLVMSVPYGSISGDVTTRGLC